MPSLNSLGNYCYKRIQPRVNFDPSFHDVPKHRLSTYLWVFGWLAQFGHPSVGDRLNYGSGEFRGTRAVAPNSERQTVILGQRLSSSKLRASISCELCRSLYTFAHHNECEQVWNGQIWRVGPRSPKSNQTCGASKVNPQWSLCLHHPTSILEYIVVATALQAPRSQPWPSSRCHTQKRSELSHASFSSTKTAALGHDTS
jgi:hypothetical protein